MSTSVFDFSIGATSFFSRSCQPQPFKAHGERTPSLSSPPSPPTHSRVVLHVEAQRSEKKL